MKNIGSKIWLVFQLLYAAVFLVFILLFILLIILLFIYYVFHPANMHISGSPKQALIDGTITITLMSYWGDKIFKTK